MNDVDAIVVSSAGATLRAPPPGAGATNSACQNQAMPAPDPDENSCSTGVLVSYGKFRFFDIGDLSGEPLFNPACPRNLIGGADAYLVAHHGAGEARSYGAFSGSV